MYFIILQSVHRMDDSGCSDTFRNGQSSEILSAGVTYFFFFFTQLGLEWFVSGYFSIEMNSRLVIFPSCRRNSPKYAGFQDAVQWCVDSIPRVALQLL